jgi:molybdenum cofactor biosynthesis enzyme MoaA
MIKKKRKFCPKCGAKLKLKDTYCTSCGYSFKKRKTIRVNKILLIIIIFLILWTALRITIGKPIIPQPLIDIVKNITTRG